MMAAILFALIPLRNAVPGSPPIGSIIDFGSFFIAEAVISLALISSVLVGFRHQMAIERGENDAASRSTRRSSRSRSQSAPYSSGLRHCRLDERQLTESPAAERISENARSMASVASWGSSTVAPSVSTEMLSWST